MVVGSAESEIGSAGYLAQQLNMRVLSVDYRLAPENTIQDAIDDGLTVYKYISYPYFILREILSENIYRNASTLTNCPSLRHVAALYMF